MKKKPFITKEFVDKYSNASFETYDYEDHPFKNYSLLQLKKLLGLRNIKPVSGNQQLNYGEENDSLPESFNSLIQWSECIKEIRDQGHCGSCWAHAASEVLSDRFCIASNGTVNVTLSPQEMVSCDWLDHGCNGGILTTSWLYLRLFGISTDDCHPYHSGDGSVEWCPLFDWKCNDGSTYKKYKASSFYYLLTINQIKTDIMTNGPVETGFSVYDDFMNYKGGVYKRTSDNFLGGHAVKIVGWGKENDTEHWIVANSWSPKWGENGFFRIAFGECSFENGIIAGLPMV